MTPASASTPLPSPDGRYRLRLTVSDAESNPEGETQTVSRVTEPFLIDNTQPRVESLTAAAEDGRLRVRFNAADGTTKIAAAEYSLDGAEWESASPATGLFDSTEAEFDFLTAEAGEGEHTLAVRVRDERGNQAAAKTVVR